MKTAVAQPRCQPGDIAGNLARRERWLLQCAGCRRHGMAMASCRLMADNGRDDFPPGHSMIVDRTGELVALIPGSVVFEHLRERVASGEVLGDCARATGQR